MLLVFGKAGGVISSSLRGSLPEPIQACEVTRLRMYCPTLFVAGLLLSLTGSAAVRPHHHLGTHALVHHSMTTRTHHGITEHAAVASMSSERATEIQSALIEHGYLAGEATGTWDAASYAAMQRMQSDNGWQTKLVPDSRALIKLGLGPNSTSASAIVPASSEGQTF